MIPTSMSGIVVSLFECRILSLAIQSLLSFALYLLRRVSLHYSIQYHPIHLTCTICMYIGCADETNNTLKFAARAKKITLAPAAINEQMDDKSLLRHYESEIFSLKNMVNDLIGKLQAVAPGTVLPDVAMQSIGASAGGTVGPYIKSAVMKVAYSFILLTYIELSDLIDCLIACS